MGKKYTTEEEKEKKRRYSLKRYYEKRETILEKRKDFYKQNKNTILERNKQWKETNSEVIKKWKDENKQNISEYNKKYIKTPNGRANNLLNSYKHQDRDANRGECTLTTKWIIDNIFSQKCIYCGESDWEKLGCDRIDNTKPHTEDNVVCCCGECNSKRGTKSFEEFLAEYKKDLEDIATT